MPRWQRGTGLHSLKFQRASNGALMHPVFPKRRSGLRRFHQTSKTISVWCLLSKTFRGTFFSSCLRWRTMGNSLQVKKKKEFARSESGSAKMLMSCCFFFYRKGANLPGAGNHPQKKIKHTKKKNPKQTKTKRWGLFCPFHSAFFCASFVVLSRAGSTVPSRFSW